MVGSQFHAGTPLERPLSPIGLGSDSGWEDVSDSGYEARLRALQAGMLKGQVYQGDECGAGGGLLEPPIMRIFGGSTSPSDVEDEGEGKEQVHHGYHHKWDG